MKSAEGKHRDKARGKRWPLILSLAAILGPPLLVLACVAFVNWRGASRWEAVRDRLEAAGESLEVEKILAPDVPDADNFAAIPMLHGIADPRSGEAAEKRARLEAVSIEATAYNNVGPPSPRGHEFGRVPDYAAWEEYLRREERFALPEANAESTSAGRVLAALDEAYGDVFAELAKGTERPRSQFLPPIGEGLKRVDFHYRHEVPHVATILTLSKTIALRIGAAAAAGDVRAGRESLAICFRLNEAFRHDHSYLSQLFAVGNLAIILAPLWETITSRSWGEDDLRWLEEELEKVEFAKGLASSLRLGIVGHVQGLDYLKKHAGEGLMLPGGAVVGGSAGAGGGGGGLAGAKATLESWMQHWPHLIPNGWYDMNKANLVSFIYDFYIVPLDRGGFAGLLELDGEIQKALEEAQENKVVNYFTLMVGRGYQSVDRNFAYHLDVLKRARAAIAVERYFLRHGRYPDALEEVVPEFIDAIPVSPAGGVPVRYRRDESNGRYVIYSPGWDGEDDGGKRHLFPSAPQKTQFAGEAYDGDWVWSCVP